MVIHATILENKFIRLTLRPEFSSLVGSRDIHRERLSTTVTVPDGGAIVIGGYSSGSNTIASALFSYNHQQHSRQTLIMVKASIMDLKELAPAPEIK